MARSAFIFLGRESNTWLSSGEWWGQRREKEKDEGGERREEGGGRREEGGERREEGGVKGEGGKRERLSYRIIFPDRITFHVQLHNTLVDVTTWIDTIGSGYRVFRANSVHQ